MRLVIGARQSDLARLQAKSVGQALQLRHPDLEVEYVFKTSLGDQNQDQPLWKMPEKGVFTEDFVADLTSGRCDIIVHSWKDLPTGSRGATTIAATISRADVRDVLLCKRSAVSCKRHKLRLFSSSPRRAYNLHSFLPKALPWQPESIEFVAVRGNIATRIKKYLQEDIDGLVVAKAALDRLLNTTEEEYEVSREIIKYALTQSLWMVLPVRENPPAAAQGALALEIRTDDARVRKLVEAINDREAFENVEKERQTLSFFGGGCHQKIGVAVLSRDYGSFQVLKGQSDAGEILDRVEFVGRREHLAPESWAQCFPHATSDGKFYERKAHSIEAPAWWGRPLAQGGRGLFVSRQNALPESWSPRSDQLIWTAGLKTWSQLAARGHWVSGSFEGLGENEMTRIEMLTGGHLDWVKLTHDEGAHSGIEWLSTYRLEELEIDFNQWQGRTHFYWMSGTAFRRALRADPELRKKIHFCGPGHTYTALREQLGPDAAVYVFPSYEDWTRTMQATARR